MMGYVNACLRGKCQKQSGAREPQSSDIKRSPSLEGALAVNT